MQSEKTKLEKKERTFIKVSKIHIYGIDEMTEEELIICGCDKFKIEKSQEPNKIDVTIDKWYYNQIFDPEFSIGMSLRQLDIAESIQEEVSMAKQWSIFAIKFPDSNNLFDRLNKKHEEIELVTLEDGDKFTFEGCELAMRRKKVEESKSGYVEEAKKENKVKFSKNYKVNTIPKNLDNDTKPRIASIQSSSNS